MNPLLTALQRHISTSAPRGGEVRIHEEHVEIILYLDPDGIETLTESWPIPRPGQEPWLMRSLGAMFGEVHCKLFGRTYQRLSSPMLPLVDASLFEPMDAFEVIDEVVEDPFVLEEVRAQTHNERVERMGRTQSQPVNGELAHQFALMVQGGDEPDVFQRATSLLDASAIQARLMTTQAAPTLSLDPKERQAELQRQIERQGGRVRWDASGGMTAFMDAGPLTHEEVFSARDLATIPVVELVSRVLEGAGKLRRKS